MTTNSCQTQLLAFGFGMFFFYYIRFLVMEKTPSYALPFLGVLLLLRTVVWISERIGSNNEE
jgi:hypothetical protein